MLKVGLNGLLGIIVIEIQTDKDLGIAPPSDLPNLLEINQENFLKALNFTSIHGCFFNMGLE